MTGSRPGFVLEVDRSTPPVLFHAGEEFHLERLPVGARVIYPPEPVTPLDDPDAAIRHALLHPVGDSEPLPALLRPGMRLTIAFDNQAVPLPRMRRPDNRQRVIEAVLEMAADAGVDDVVLVVAHGLHRRMTEAELRHVLGDRVYDAFAPNGLLVQHDAEDHDNLVLVGSTAEGEDVEVNKRAATSDLLVYVNLNLVAMDGGHKSTMTGLTSYRSLKANHNVHSLHHSRSLMDPQRSALHHSCWRMGRVLAAQGPKIFQIETTVNTDTFPKQFAFLQKREWEWSARDRASYLATAKGIERIPPGLAHKMFHGIHSPQRMTSVQAGEVEAVHALTVEHVYRQHLVAVEGQTDVVTMGLPFVGPYNVNSVMNPLLVMCLGLGYFFNMYRGKPLVRPGGVLIIRHRTPWAFHPVHHPSYIDFFEQVLPETTDPAEIEAKFEEDFATDPWYIHLYRTSYAYHGVHAFYMWYWGAHALQYLNGNVIIVGGNARAVRRMGFKPASTLHDALEMAEDVVGPQPSITHFHCPPIMVADVT